MLSRLPFSHRSPFIDEVWHAHILCTKDYRKFCDDVFGAYLDHMPGFGGFNWTHYENTMRTYDWRFAEPDASDYRKYQLADIWPSREALEELMGVNVESSASEPSSLQGCACGPCEADMSGSGDGDSFSCF